MIKFISCYLREVSSKYLALFLLLGSIFLYPSAANAEDILINLDANTAYVDVVIQVDTTTAYVVTTTTGPRFEIVDSVTVERVAWVDSWLWLYRGVADSTTVNAIAADDDGNSSPINFWASRLSGVLTADTYTIRATSYDYVVAGQRAIGTYTLSSNLIPPRVETTTAVIDTPTVVVEPAPIPVAPAPEPPVINVYIPPIAELPPIEVEVAPIPVESPPIEAELPPIPIELPPIEVELPPIEVELPPIEVELPQIPVELAPSTPADLPELIPLAPPVEALIARVQEDIAGIDNGGIDFYGTKTQPQVIGEDGKLTPAPPPPGSGEYLDPQAITITETFIGQPGGVAFNSPDVAVPVEPIVLNIEIPGVGQAAQAMADAYVALANVGSDMSPVTRKKAKKILVTTILGSVIIRRFP